MDSKDEALQKVYGVGVKLSERILRYRGQFEGGFADMVELQGVYGLSDEVIERIRKNLPLKIREAFNLLTLTKPHKKRL